ncbi:MAG: Apolipoprotein N-acyltransferase [Verrucomicrobiota bacterium]|jgi:apolipoprotein N-acyltransferase
MMMKKMSPPDTIAGAAAPADLKHPFRMHPLLRYFLATLAAMAWCASLPPLSWSWSIWLAPALLHLACLGWNDRRLWGIGIYFGLLLNTLNFSFLHHIQLLVPFGIGICYCGLTALFCRLSGAFNEALLWRDVTAPRAGILPQPSPRSVILGALGTTALFAALEWVRGWLWTGVPFATLAVSQAEVPATLLSARVWGQSGLSLMIALVSFSLSAALGAWLLGRRDACKAVASGLGLALAAIVVILAVAATYLPPKTDARLQVRLVQGLYLPLMGATEEEYFQQLDEAPLTYFQLSLKRGVQPELIVWPETPLPCSYPKHPRFVEAVVMTTSRAGAPMIFGTPTELPTVSGSRPLRYNSSVWVDAAGQQQGLYSKVHTLPYGEYFPFRYLLPRSWHEKFEDMSGMGASLSEGMNTNVFHPRADAAIGTPICFESLFSGISLRFRRQGADLLLVLSNDSWFKDSCGGARHAAHSALRAVECGVPVMRCGTYGFTQVHGPDGQVFAKLRADDGSPFVRDALDVSVPYLRKAPPTPWMLYPWAADLVAVLGALASMIWLGYRWHRLRLARAESLASASA